MHLAQELVDYIIDFLHDDPVTLARLPSVSWAWVGRTRTHLCENLRITRSKLLSADPSYLTPLGGYVKTLHLTWPRDLTSPATILNCFQRSGPHTLAIHSFELHSLDEPTLRQDFAKFPCTSITTLELHEVSPTHRTLLILLSLFPNVDNLTISVNRWWKDGPGPDPSGDNDGDTIQRISTPRLRGRFKFLDPPGQGFWGFNRGELLHTLAALPLQFQTVSLDIREQSWEEVSAFLNSCSKTVGKVFTGLPYPDHLVYSPLLFGFANLEELRISMWAVGGPPPQIVHPLLRSVASPHLRRVIVDVEVYGKATGRIQWPLLDETLVNLVERHRAYGNLALQISTTVNPEKIRALLPRAAEEGGLEHADSPQNRSRYPSPTTQFISSSSSTFSKCPPSSIPPLLEPFVLGATNQTFIGVIMDASHDSVSSPGNQTSQGFLAPNPMSI